jgi:hypothetical protein
MYHMISSFPRMNHRSRLRIASTSAVGNFSTQPPHLTMAGRAGAIVTFASSVSPNVRFVGLVAVIVTLMGCVVFTTTSNTPCEATLRASIQAMDPTLDTDTLSPAAVRLALERLASSTAGELIVISRSLGMHSAVVNAAGATLDPMADTDGMSSEDALSLLNRSASLYARAFAEINEAITSKSWLDGAQDLFRSLTKDETVADRLNATVTKVQSFVNDARHLQLDRDALRSQLRLAEADRDVLRMERDALWTYLLSADGAALPALLFVAVLAIGCIVWGCTSSSADSNGHVRF